MKVKLLFVDDVEETIDDIMAVLQSRGMEVRCLNLVKTIEVEEMRERLRGLIGEFQPHACAVDLFFSKKNLGAALAGEIRRGPRFSFYLTAHEVDELEPPFTPNLDIVSKIPGAPNSTAGAIVELLSREGIAQIHADQSVTLADIGDPAT